MTSPSTLRRTPLYSLHRQHGAKIVPFAGYEMPVNYAEGILAEHLHTRRFAGLFDVSHMGQIVVRLDGHGGDVDQDDVTQKGKTETTALALESLIPADLLALPAGRQRYGLFTTPEGGVIDDLMVQNLGDRFVLVVNAACKQPDFAHLRRHLAPRFAGVAGQLELADNLALLALQGPASAAVMASLGHDLAAMKFMDVRELVIDGVTCTVSRSGYTGEDGFELSLPAADAERLARRLLAESSVKLIGLGARDSLRLEAGLCLYGHDLTTATTPIEAGLNWAISAARRTGGQRPGGFPGDHIILPQMPKNVERVRVGLLPEGRAPVREGAPLLDAESNPVGEVTSGGFSPSLGCPISMGYVHQPHAAIGTRLQAVVRGKPLPLVVSQLPFVATHYYR